MGEATREGRTRAYVKVKKQKDTNTGRMLTCLAVGVNVKQRATHHQFIPSDGGGR